MKNQTIDELDGLAAATRRDTGVEAVTLLTAGALACVTIGLNLATSRTTGGALEALHGYGSMALALLVPMALAFVWLFLRRRESRRGVGRQSRVVGWTALWVAVLFLVVGLGYLLTWVLGPYPVLMGLVLLAGIRFSSRLLLAWGLVAGGLGLFVGMFQFNNRMGLPAMDTAVGIAIAAATVVMGVVVATRGQQA